MTTSREITKRTLSRNVCVWVCCAAPKILGRHIATLALADVASICELYRML